MTLTELVTPAPAHPLVSDTLVGMTVPAPALAPVVAIEMRDEDDPPPDPRENP